MDLKKISGNIIFLDIDGCLTSVEDGSSFLCMDENTYRISERKLEIFGNLLKETNAKVIISSNWRKFRDDGVWIHGKCRFRNNLPSLRKWLGKRYIGDLPFYRGMTKSQTMESWGISVGVDFSKINFIVIDDDLSEGFLENPKFSGRYIHCDPMTGLTDEQCSYAKALFDERLKTT